MFATLSFVRLLIALQFCLTSAFAFDATRGNSGRSLVASSPRSLEPRSESIHFTNRADLLYSDGDNADGAQAFAAKVSISSAKPILILENFEHLFDGITCDPNRITLTGSYRNKLWERKRFDELIGGHVITSHPGCNPRHSRLPYRVLNTEHHSDHAVTLTVTPVLWKDSFDTFKVEMGYTNQGHAVRPHYPDKRQLAAGQANSTTSAIPFDPSIVPSVVDPVPQPASSSTLYGFDLAGSLISKSLGPFDTPVGKPPIEIGCVNCTTFGTVDVTFASFEWTCGFHPNVSDISSCIAGGANITATGLGAHMEMSANLSDAFTFSVPIAQLQSKFSIAIPDVGSTSLVLGNVLAGGYNLSGDVGMTYGFDLAIPDGSNIMLQAADPADSSISGFDNAKITALPIQTDASLQSVDLWVALRAIVKASFQLDEHFEMSGDLAAGVYVDAPVLSATITPVTNVDAHCNQLSAAVMTGTPGLNVSTSAMNVTFSAGWDFGAFLRADAEIVGQVFDSDDHDVGKQGSYPLDGMCVNFQNTSTTVMMGQAENSSSSDHTNNKSSSSSSHSEIWRAVPLAVALFLASSVFAML